MLQLGYGLLMLLNMFGVCSFWSGSKKDRILLPSFCLFLVRYQHPTDLSLLGSKFIQVMVDPNPLRRPSAKEIVANPIFDRPQKAAKAK